MNIGSMAKGMNDVQAWIHDVVQDDGEADQALSFSADSFPLQGVGGFRSLRARPLYTAAPSEILLAYENMIADHAALQQQLAAAREALDRIRRVAETGTAESFLALSDDDKRKWFALALDESTRRKHAEELLDSGCIVTHDRDEFGVEQRTLRCGLNLRDAIKLGMDESAVYAALATLQRDRQP